MGVKDRTRVCPDCGSKNISKTVAGKDENGEFYHHRYKARIHCRNCNKLHWIENIIPAFKIT
jgi:transcription elongation factor Elf1